MDAMTALALQIEWGADEALSERPRDWRSVAPPPVAAEPPPMADTRPVQPLAAGLPVPALARARALAETAPTRAALREALAGFDGCALRDTATNLVFEAGDPAAGIVLVADVPRAAEDRAGTPFAGASAAFLERMLGSIGLSPGEVFATSLMPWRPPGDRQPTDSEVQMCLPFLWRHLALLEPRWILLMGSLAVRALLPTAGRRSRSAWLTLAIPGRAREVPTLALGAPGHIQATPSAKRDAWASLIRLRRALDEDMTRSDGPGPAS